MDTGHHTPVHLRTSDLDEAVTAVSQVYCVHDVKIVGSNRGIQAKLDTLPSPRQQLVSLSYSAPVVIDAGNFDNLMLMMTCTEGHASARQRGVSQTWSRGHTLPLSPGLRTRLEFDRTFSQTSARLDIPLMEDMCARLLNRQLDQPLRLELTPFSESLECAWQNAVQLNSKLGTLAAELSSFATSRLEEFLATLILEQHPHNYSDLLLKPDAAAAPRLVREAEQLMRSGSSHASVSSVAKALGVSLRSLESGFREWKQLSPTEFMRRLRLDAARGELQDPSEMTTVTSVALGNGFLHLARFSAYYRSAFGELPSQTLRRNRRRQRR